MVVLVALAATVGIGILRGAGSPVETASVTGGRSDSRALDRETDAAARPELFVHVSGAVVAPGLYLLRDGARVVDAVAAAGGFADGADENAVNLARPIGDGEQLVVPLVGAAPAAGAAPVGDGRINLNTATPSDLDTLPRIGPAMAERIIAWRDENGRFTSVDDLLAVPGIGDKMLEALRDLVTV